MKKGLFIFFASLAICNYLSAQINQQEIDRLKTQLSEAKTDTAKSQFDFLLSIGYRFSNIDSSLLYADKALAIAKKREVLNVRAVSISHRRAHPGRR